MFKKIKFFLWLFVFPLSIYATPSTHIWAPSTDIQPFGVVHVTSDLYLPSERDAKGNRPDTVTSLGLTVGILPFKGLKMEVGFDHKSGTAELDDYPVYFNGKLGIPEGGWGKHLPALAIGIYDVGTERNKTDYNIFYTKVAKSFRVENFSLGRLSVGYFRGNTKLLRDKDGSRDNHGVFAAWERSLSGNLDRLWVCVEYMGTQSSYGSWNFGFAWKFSENTSVIFGYNRYHNRNLADTFTMQVDIDFDLFSKLFKERS